LECYIKSKKFWYHVQKLREVLIDILVQEDVDIIYTFYYEKSLDSDHVKKIADIVEKHGGKLYFVQLITDVKTLVKRVLGEAREGYKKLHPVKNLTKELKNMNLFSPVPFVDTFTIDNTKISSKKAALMIKKHYKL